MAVSGVRDMFGSRGMQSLVPTSLPVDATFMNPVAQFGMTQGTFMPSFY